MGISMGMVGMGTGGPMGMVGMGTGGFENEDF